MPAARAELDTHVPGWVSWPERLVQPGTGPGKQVIRYHPDSVRA